MTDDIEILQTIYARFNARDIDGVLNVLADDVAWANGMDGGHEHGKAAVRAYWTRQWSMVDPHVEPVAFDRQTDGSISVRVLQTIRDLDGNPLTRQEHGLKDQTVEHIFRLEHGQVTRFDIEKPG